VKTQALSEEQKNLIYRATEQSWLLDTVHQSPAIAILWNRQTWAVQALSQGIEQLGYHPEDFIGGSISFDTIIHPDDRQRVFDECQQFADQEVHIYTQEYRVFTKDNQVRWIEDYTRATPSGGLFQGILLDITERKNAEEKLRQNIRFQEHLLGLTKEGLKHGFSSQMYHRLLEVAIELIPGAQAGSIAVQQNDTFHFMAAVGYDLEALRQTHLGPNEPMSLSNHEQAAIFTQEDLRIFNTDQNIPQERREVFLQAGKANEIKSLISAPILVEGQTLAYMYLDNFKSTDAFRPQDLALASALATEAGSLLQRLKTEEQLAQLAQYNERLLDLVNSSLRDGLDENFYQRTLEARRWLVRICSSRGLRPRGVTRSHLADRR
jgi:PAS domain S-box-containing protein